MWVFLEFLSFQRVYNIAHAVLHVFWHNKCWRIDSGLLLLAGRLDTILR